MRCFNVCVMVLLIAGCITNPNREALLSIWNNATPLNISGGAEEKLIQLVLPKNETATLILRNIPVTHVGIQYPDEQSPNKAIEHQLFGSVGNSSIQEVRISEDRRFVFVKGNIVAYSTEGVKQPVAVVNVYDLKHRIFLDSIVTE